MRKQIRGRRRRIVLMGSPGQRPHQRADIEYQRGCLLTIERMDLWQLSIKSVGIGVAIANWQQSIRHEREIAAKLLILSKPRDISWHDQVIAVVAAEQKYADQCSIVGSAAGECAHHSEAVHRSRDSE